MSAHGLGLSGGQEGGARRYSRFFSREVANVGFAGLSEIRLAEPWVEAEDSAVLLGLAHPLGGCLSAVLLGRLNVDVAQLVAAEILKSRHAVAPMASATEIPLSTRLPQAPPLREREHKGNATSAGGLPLAAEGAYRAVCQQRLPCRSINSPQLGENLRRNEVGLSHMSTHAQTAARYLSHSGSAMSGLSWPAVRRSISSWRSSGGYVFHCATAGCVHLSSASAKPFCEPNRSIASDVFMGVNHKCADVGPQAQNISALMFSGYSPENIRCMDTIGTRVKALRLARGMTQLGLGKKIGVSQPAIAMIESGVTVSLSGDVLAGLCHHLTSTPNYILFGAGTVGGHEAAMQLAEVSRLAQDMSPQALESLLTTARALSRADSGGANVADPFRETAPTPPPLPKTAPPRATKPEPAKQLARLHKHKPSKSKKGSE